MGYALQLGAWSSVFAVPGALVDRYIKTADGDQLKVILWLLRNNGRSYSAEEIATKALKIASEICVYTNDNIKCETV